MGKQTIVVPTVRDEGGDKYVPFCRFRWHPGVSKDYRACEARKCTHYMRLYFKGAYQRLGNNEPPEGCLNGLAGLLGDGI
jgi:hypothetical protein